MVHRGRALPVIWRELKRRSASVAFSEYREMLHQAAHRLPHGVKVVVLADRGFIHTEKGEWYGLVNLAFDHNSLNGEFWAIEFKIYTYCYAAD